tara:strand:- start:42846 stop:43466 length:621 start_codon:yes stop_codon:yes gene_type:complete
MIDKEMLRALVSNHLKLEHLYLATRFKGNSKKLVRKQWSVMQVRTRQYYYDVMVWTRAEVYLREKRPDCDHRVFVTVYGEIIPKPVTGRTVKQKSLTSMRVYIGLAKYIHDLWVRVPMILNVRPKVVQKAALSEYAYKWSLRQAKGDYGIYAHKLYDHDRTYNGWVICYSDGTQITQTPCQHEWEAWSHAYQSMIHGIVEPLMLDG